MLIHQLEQRRIGIGRSLKHIRFIKHFPGITGHCDKTEKENIPQKRQGNPEKLLDKICTVHNSRFIIIARNTQKSGQNNYRKPRNTAPAKQNDYRNARPPGTGQPVYRLCAEKLQKLIDKPGVGIKQHFKY